MKRFLSVALFALAIAAAPMPASADDALHGCFGKTDVCVGPTASAAVVGYNLVTHSVSLGALPVGAVGVEVTAYTSQWYRAGLSLNLAATAQEVGGNFLAGAFILSFAEYLRLGAMFRTVGDSAQWTLLAGLGYGGGRAPVP